MNLNEIIDLAFNIYGNEILSKSEIDMLISDYLNAGGVNISEYSEEDIERMFNYLFE